MAEEQNDKDRKEVAEAPVVGQRSHMPVHPHNAHDDIREPSPARLRFLAFATIVVLSLAAGFLGGWLGNKNNSGSSGSVEQQQVVLKTQGQLISKIAKDVGQSVVSVEVISQGITEDSFFGFGQPTEQQSAGTGFIIDKDGLIITNRHVVPAGASRVNITLADGTKFEDVEIIGRTSESDPLDIAFLKVKDTKGKDLVPVKIGDSSKMLVGESVVAIGNALGQFQNTVTAGIISGYGRSVVASDASGQSTESLENLFQTDAAINQGNSGGPLVNLEGEVIGINTAVAGDAENIGFSIPVNDVKGLIESVKTKGKLERPFLGVVFIPITADMAKQYDLSVDYGAYVPPSIMVEQDSVIDNGPADKAGIQEGDIIIKVNDDKVDESHSLTSLLGKHKVGDKVEITLVRDGKERVVEATLQAAPAN